MLVVVEGCESPGNSWDNIDRVNSSRLLGEKRVPMPLCSPQIPRGLPWDRTAVRGGRRGTGFFPFFPVEKYCSVRIFGIT